MDAGKTTTTEQMLFHAGQIRRAGRVDDGTTRTDYLDVERARGISVRAATTALPWRDHLINLVDTPGHTDFAAEVESAIRVIDGAVLIISAVEGVQAHTETLWHALRARGMPTILYINKLDRYGASPERVLEQSRQRLHALSRAGEVFPVLFGASLKGIGMRELLDGVVDLLPPSPEPESGGLAGVIFKVERDPIMGRVGYVRLYSGQLFPRDAVKLPGRTEPVRIVQIRKSLADHTVDTGALGTGDIAALCGLSGVRAGDVIGDPGGVPPMFQIAHPVLQVKVHPEQEREQPKVLAALEELAEEDPHLGVAYLQDLRELNLTVMGTIQVEIIQSLLQSRFGLVARFDPPTVIYHETVLGVREWESFYFLGNAYATLRLRFEPAAPGSGLTYVNKTRHDDIRPQFEQEAARAALATLQQGQLGWQVTDAVVTLLYGEHDENLCLSTVGDYTICAPMAVMGALDQARTRLLEPLYAFRLSIPEEAAGRVLGELVAMRATMGVPESSRGRLLIEGRVPVATSLSFGARLSGLTGGRGIWTTTRAEYQPAPPETQAVRERVRVNPLDTPRYLLHVRKAMQGGSGRG